jgi:hypothetical protein
MRLSDRLDGQRPAPIEDSGDASSATDVWFQISSREPAALPVVEQLLDGIGQRILDPVHVS